MSEILSREEFEEWKRGPASARYVTTEAAQATIEAMAVVVQEYAMYESRADSPEVQRAMDLFYETGWLVEASE